MHPFFSIVIPVYNVAPYLCECLDSVQAQTFGNWEALCVDDGSTDGSDAILDGYAAKDGRLRIIHQANAGVSAARNTALDVAKGEWICFLDADDKVGPHWLGDIAEGAAKHPNVDWIRTSYREWHEGQEPSPWPEGSKHRQTEQVFNDANSSVWTILAQSPAMTVNVMRRTTIASVRFSTGIKYCEDGCFVLDVVFLSKASTMLTIPNEDYAYRMRMTSAIHSMTFQGLQDALEALLARWKRAPGERGVFSPNIDRFIYRCHHAHPNIANRDAQQLQQFLRKASWCGFFSPFRFKGKKLCRWLLFLLLGNSQILFHKFGWDWFVPAQKVAKSK